tara:strand:- start:2538 stop:2780 length:243 start_codon:yes stop_codon:yes gene_type:complete
MKVSAEVTVNNGTYEEWLEFFNSYESKRSEFVRNEIIKQISASKIQVDFEIIDLEGLTALSSDPGIIDEEKRLGVVTIIK